MAQSVSAPFSSLFGKDWQLGREIWISQSPVPSTTLINLNLEN